MHFVASVLSAFPFNPPTDFATVEQIILRWIHFLAGITWVGLLYFFNLVNVPFMKEMDAPTKGKVVPSLMPKALWWFRWGAVVTVLVGVAYWSQIAATDAHNAGVKAGALFGSFYGIWTIAFILIMGLVMMLNDGRLLGAGTVLIVVIAAWMFLTMNSHGWESNRTLSIGVGGGLGWIMMFNVWGIIWRFQKKIIGWTADNAANGTPIPADAAKLARRAFLASRANFWLSFPMLFFMAAASHYPMFGK
jgi:uncharacterized membrane protein